MKYWEISLCEKISLIFKKAVDFENYDIQDFTHKFLTSKVAQYIINFRSDIISQGELYIIDLLIEEKGEIKKNNDDSWLVSEWFGYLIGYCVVQGKTLKELSKLDWEAIDFAYEKLHTQSLGYSMDYIFEKFNKK